MRSSLPSDPENDLAAALVSFTTTATMLRHLRDSGHIPPWAAARLIASVIGVLEQIQFASGIEVPGVHELIAKVAEEFGLTVPIPGVAQH